MGASAFQLGILNEAIDSYKKTILLNPNFLNTYCNMGVALNQKGKVDEAIELYNKASQSSQIMLMHIITWVMLLKTKVNLMKQLRHIKAQY